MVEAIIIKWDDTRQIGTAKSSEGKTYQLQYSDGQNLFSDEEHSVPTLTGHHEQPVGYQLKVPQVGDPVLIKLSSIIEDTYNWCYMRHYVDIAERRYGTAFITDSKPTSS